MANFAELDKNNIVLRIILIGDEYITDEFGFLQEHLGIDFIKNVLKLTENKWVRCAENRDDKFRKNAPGIGWMYDEKLDAFIPPKTPEYPSLILNELTCLWEPPIPKPTSTDGTTYNWNEQHQKWEINRLI